MKTEQATVFVTEDGKKFHDEAKAIAHEKSLNNTRYYKVRYGPDLNETGNRLKVGYLIVKASWGHNLWAEDWLFNNFGNRIAFVQGCAPTENWTFGRVEVSQVDYSNVLETINKL
ncbi:hypothetical protein J6TS2_50600 [Heyndrickxia sporothermodurans]|nr:hypothetical protein J6TS2_50600 [Heyndrickxia sporothermodurans]